MVVVVPSGLLKMKSCIGLRARSAPRRAPSESACPAGPAPARTRSSRSASVRCGKPRGGRPAWLRGLAEWGAVGGLCKLTKARPGLIALEFLWADLRRERRPRYHV